MSDNIKIIFFTILTKVKSAETKLKRVSQKLFAWVQVMLNKTCSENIIQS